MNTIKVERLNDIAILPLDTNGFEKLEPSKKKLAYHLAQAGLWGKMICLDQMSKHNIPLLDSLTDIYSKTEKEDPIHQRLHESLFMLFTHGGIYHTMSGEKITLPLSKEDLNLLSVSYPEQYKIIDYVLNSEDVPAFRTVQNEGIDVVKNSGVNFYEGLTTKEVEEFRKNEYKLEQYGEEIPPFGFNEKLIKNDKGEIKREVISLHGLYGKYVEKIIESLNEALKYTENEKQHNSIAALIEFYKTGDAKLFDKYSIAWTLDQSSEIYFINGLIESYDDPLGIGCTFESLIAFKNPIQTEKVNKIIENIQWFEDNLPIDKSFKKEKANGLSASSITVVSMAGDTSPVLPLGVNLPNSDWIRKKHGSKSVSLANVDSSRSGYESVLREALYLPQYQSIINQYGDLTSGLHTDLHEIAGHGSGKVNPGVNTDVLSTYYSTIEECRADLVALYYIADEKLKEFGVFDSSVNVKEAALAKYIVYLTNGAIAQLRRVKEGNDLTQAHFRNRQLISNWIFNHANPEKVRMIKDNGRYVIEINDLEHVKEMFGVLLAEIQRIKSEGDFEAARDIVLKYGTKVNPIIHKEIVARIAKLNLATVTGFLTPELVEVDNDIIIVQPESFMEQQLRFYKEYKL